MKNTRKRIAAAALIGAGVLGATAWAQRPWGGGAQAWGEQEQPGPWHGRPGMMMQHKSGGAPPWARGNQANPWGPGQAMAPQAYGPQAGPQAGLQGMGPGQRRGRMMQQRGAGAPPWARGNQTNQWGPGQAAGPQAYGPQAGPQAGPQGMGPGQRRGRMMQQQQGEAGAPPWARGNQANQWGPGRAMAPQAYGPQAGPQAGLQGMGPGQRRGQGRFGRQGAGQDQTGFHGRRGGGPGGPGEPGQGREEAREARLGRLQEHLDVADEEWEAIEPLITKLGEARAGQARGRLSQARARFAEGRGGPNRPQVEIPDEVQDLQEALGNDEATPEELKTMIEALRTARAAEATELEAARDELRTKLTPRQEAQLILMGLLD